MKNEELFRLEFFILHFYTLSGVQLCIFNGIHTAGVTPVASVTLDRQSASSITPGYTSGMTSRLWSFRNIAASFVRLLILQARQLCGLDFQTKLMFWFGLEKQPMDIKCMGVNPA